MEYTVTAIDADGERSGPLSITVEPFDMWDRLPNRALRYEILRDDGFTIVTSGISFLGLVARVDRRARQRDHPRFGEPDPLLLWLAGCGYAAWLSGVSGIDRPVPSMKRTGRPCQSHSGGALSLTCWPTAL